MSCALVRDVTMFQARDWSVRDGARCFRFVIGQYVTVHGDVISHVNISHVSVEDGGEYACTAENRAGRAGHAARLNVYGLPYVRPMPKVTAVAGETLLLKCPVAGFPIEDIRWERGRDKYPLRGRNKLG